MRIAILDDYEGAWSQSPLLSRLQELGQTVVYTDPGDAREQLRGVQVAVANRERTRFPAELLREMPALRLIAQTGTGVAHIDVAAATALGIAIATTPNQSAASVAELTFGLLLAVARRIPYGDGWLRHGRWRPTLGVELAGRTLGIVGLGAIGAAIARRALAFDMRVLAWGREGSARQAAELGVTYVPDLDDLLRQADVVTLCLRLTPETRGLLDARRLGLMKPGVLLINTARGALVDEVALVAALQQGRLGGAGLDVFATEPLPPDHPLTRLENVVLSPHVGWVTAGVYSRFIREVVASVEGFIVGHPRNILNPGYIRAPRPS